MTLSMVSGLIKPHQLSKVSITIALTGLLKRVSVLLNSKNMPEAPRVNITTYFELETEIILWTDMNENPISAPEILENLVNQASQRIKVSRNHEENYDLLDPQGV